MSLAILSIVGLGAMSVLTGTIESQNKLERILNKGFTHLSYNPKGFPIYKPVLTYVTKPGWFRVPSPRALHPQTKALQGSLVNDAVVVQISKADLAADTPEWSLCKGDDSVRVVCSKFVDGLASVQFKLNQMQPPPSAIVRLRVKWPSLPDGHPVKDSAEYVVTIPYIRDCDIDPLTPDGPRFLEHGTWQMEANGPADKYGCQANWIRYRCLNGALEKIPFQKSCQQGSEIR